MKFSEQWLREWVNPPVDTKTLAAQLTMAGLEVESVLPVAGSFEKVVVGYVVSAEKHPDADRLRVCKVDIGQPTHLDIVCGGANVRTGLKVAVVLVGGKIGDLVIKEAKLRGALSQGMICSVKELGLAETSEGIMELPADAPIGEDFKTWLQLNDYAIDVHLTPNRGDCLSIAGIAREAAVLNNCELKTHDIQPVAAVIKDQFPIAVQASADCPRYLGRIIRGINAQAVTPLWMSERLRRSGLRSIHPVVDVTNYVMLELGQPLHAFDLAKLEHEIQVRHAVSDEKIVLLDGREVQLESGTLVIADKQQPQAIAGIMGGLSSSVTETTKDIFLESAFFNPLIIAGRARRYGLNTDSSYRFERGVCPVLSKQAIEYATTLLLKIVGGQPGPVVEKVSESHLPVINKIQLRKSRIEKLLGICIADNAVETILHRLGMELKKASEGWLVTVPSYRFDLLLEQDLIEEIVRIFGYDNIPITKPQTSLAFLPCSEQQTQVARLRSFLVDRGYHEAITYSFISPKQQTLMDPKQAQLTIINPISADLSVMRTSLWSGLLNAVAYNQNRQQGRVRLFETGLRFLQENADIKQEPMLAGVIAGDAYPEQWGVKAKPIDFFDIKNDVESLFALTGKNSEILFDKAEHPVLHPGQASKIICDDKVIGYMGSLHPALLRELDLVGPIYLFEIRLDALCAGILPVFKPLSKFPAIRRDISFWVEKSIPLQQIIDAVRADAKDLLNDLCLFDVYAEAGAQANTRSLALGLVLQHQDRTLVDSEVDALIEQILKTLKQKFAINLRE